MPTRQLAAIMFTDMVGYTALMQQNEQLALRRRKYVTRIFQASLKKHAGKLLQLYGDGTLSIFASALNAVRCAIEMETIFLQKPIEVRIGIHTGDVLIDHAGIYGDGVNIASRIESLATPGAVFVSEKVYDEIKNQEGISAKPLGFFELKNVQQPIQVYAISNPGIIVPSREEVKGKLKQTINSIAVLPFINYSADPENEFFCNGITEELINMLAKIDGLQVTSRTSSFAFKDKNEDVREIAAKLCVQRIIEGSVRKAGKKIRITAQLINAADGYHIWSEDYDRDLEDIFQVQDELSRTIANKLRANLTTEEHETPLVTASVQNMEAYKKYLQGLHYYDCLSPQEKNHGVELLEEATKMDPSLANAHGMLAIAYSLMAESGNIGTTKALDLINKHAAMAINADPTNAMAVLAQSVVKFFHEWDWAGAFDFLQKAVKLNPNLNMARTSLAEYYHLFLNEEKAFDEMRLAYQLNPLSPDTVAVLARLFMVTGKYKKAMEYAREALHLNSENITARYVMAYSKGHFGDWEAALKIFEQMHQSAKNCPLVLLGIGYSCARLNRRNDTEKIIEQIEELKKELPDANLEFILAILYLCLGNLKKFYEYYDACILKKSFWAIELYPSFHMRPVWYDTHVIESRKKLGLPYFKKKEQVIKTSSKAELHEYANS